MADTLSPADQTELLAEGLDIPPASYAGRERDAAVAMTLVAGYRRLTPQDQVQVLTVISDRMGFATSNPAFFQACQAAVVMIVTNPAWVPASMENDNLEAEIKLWRAARDTLRNLGFSGIVPASTKTGRSMLNSWVSGKTLGASVAGAIRMPWSAMVLAGGFAYSIADASCRDLEAEADRRGMLGTMTPLHAKRFGSGVR